MADEGGAPTGPIMQFMLHEHNALQEKMRHAISDLYLTETIVPAAIAVIYAWLYGGELGGREVPYWMWWMPLVMVMFGALRQHLRYRRLWGYETYVRSIERAIYGKPTRAGRNKPWGWETYWLKKVSRSGAPGKWRVSAHGLMRGLFWGLLIVGTFILAVQQFPTE